MASRKSPEVQRVTSRSSVTEERGEGAAGSLGGTLVDAEDDAAPEGGALTTGAGKGFLNFEAGGCASHLKLSISFAPLVHV